VGIPKLKKNGSIIPPMAITTLKKLEKDTARCLTDDFNERGWENPSSTWTYTLKHLASCYGLIDSKLRPVNKAAAKILVVCKKEWAKGVRDAKKR
jgi:hypothetical protein